MTTERAQKIWEAFCGELAQKPTDDMREALATTLRMLNSDFDGWNWGGDEPSCCVLRELFDIADALDKLEEMK